MRMLYKGETGNNLIGEAILVEKKTRRESSRKITLKMSVIADPDEVAAAYEDVRNDSSDTTW